MYIYQAANSIESYTYGSYTGTLSLNSSSAMSAGAVSRTVTFGYIRRSKTPKYTSGASGSATTETWSGTAYLTIAVNSGSSYCTLSKSNYTNSSSTTTSTLTKSTYGTTNIGSQTYTISLRQGSASGTVIASITVTTISNKPTTSVVYDGTITVNTPTLSRYNSTSSPCPAGGGTLTASATASQAGRTKYTWPSGAAATYSSYNTSTSRTPTYAVSGTGASISGSTITWASRGTTAGNQRSATVTASYGGKTSSAATTYQAHNNASTTTETRNQTVSISANRYTTSASPCPADGGTATLSYSASYEQRTKYTWPSGAAATYSSWTTKSATPTISGSATGFTRSGTTVTIAAHEGESQRSCTYTASYSGATSKSVTIYQAAAELGIGKMAIGSTFKVF